jgi:Zn-dependent metalloprotease
VIVAILLAATPAASFKADFPKAKVSEAARGGPLVSAEGFVARGMGNTPQAAAKAFVDHYGKFFAVGGDDKIGPAQQPVKGKKGTTVHFERQHQGDPIFDADLVVGLNGTNSVVSVKTVALPEKTSGSFKLSKEDAIRAAAESQSDLSRDSPPHADRGWLVSGDALQAVWHVDLVAGNPQTIWRSTIDGETGTLLIRVDLHPNTKRQKRDLAN